MGLGILGLAALGVSEEEQGECEVFGGTVELVDRVVGGVVLALLGFLAHESGRAGTVGVDVSLKTGFEQGGSINDTLPDFFFKLPVFNSVLDEVDWFNEVFLAVFLGLVALVVLGADALGPLHAVLGGNVGVDAIDVKSAGVSKVEAFVPPHEHVGVCIGSGGVLLLVADFMDKGEDSHGALRG